MRERNPEKKIDLAAAAWTALLSTLFQFERIWKVVCSIKDLKLQIQYFPSGFSEESADYMPKQAERPSHLGQRLTAPLN